MARWFDAPVPETDNVNCREANCRGRSFVAPIVDRYPVDSIHGIDSTRRHPAPCPGPRPEERGVMPVAVQKQREYPANWAGYSRAIGFAHAGGRCGLCCRAWHGRPHPVTGAIVVLTVA